MQTSIKEKDNFSLEERVLADLKAGLSGSKIAAKHHVSSKTIDKIRKSAGFAFEGTQVKAILGVIMHQFERLSTLQYLHTLNNLDLPKGQMEPIPLHEVTECHMEMYEELFQINPNYAKELVDQHHPFDCLFWESTTYLDKRQVEMKERWLKLMSKHYPEDIARLFSKEEEE